MEKIIDGISNRIVEGEIDKGRILLSEKEIYRYGYILFINLIINILSAILIGVILSEFVSVIVFLLSYIPLRTYAGGFHSVSNTRCFLISNMLIIIMCILVKCKFIVQYGFILVLVGLFLSGIIIIKNAPIQCSNKPLSICEIDKYRNCSILCWGLEFVISLCLWKSDLRVCGLVIGISNVMLGVFIIVGKYLKKGESQHGL